MDRFTKRRQRKEAQKRKRGNMIRNEDRVRDCMMRAADEIEIKEYDKAALELEEAAKFARICSSYAKGEV